MKTTLGELTITPHYRTSVRLLGGHLTSLEAEAPSPGQLADRLDQIRKSLAYPGEV